MDKLGLKIGCKVLVEKRGDIIPQVIKVTDGEGKDIEVPDECPSCGSTLEWDEKKVTKWCHNQTCDAKIVSNIEHWFKRLGVKGIGPKIIEKLVNEEKNSYDDPMVNSISDMYGLMHFKSELDEVFGEKAFSNIVKAIDSVKEITLAKFVEALGIGKVGTMASEITAIAPTIEAIDKLTVAQIADIEGFAEIKATGFVEGWKVMREEIDKILEHVKIKEQVMASVSLDGMKLCFTGSFKNPTRKERRNGKLC